MFRTYLGLIICALILQAGLTNCVLLLMASQEGGKRGVVRDLASLQPARWGPAYRGAC